MMPESKTEISDATLEIDEQRRSFRQLACLILNPANWDNSQFVGVLPNDYASLLSPLRQAICEESEYLKSKENLINYVRERVFLAINPKIQEGSLMKRIIMRLASFLLRGSIQEMQQKDAALHIQQALKDANFILDQIYQKFLPKDLTLCDILNLSLAKSLDELRKKEVSPEYKRQILIRIGCAALMLSHREKSLSEDPEEAYDLAWEAIKKEIPMTKPERAYIGSLHEPRASIAYFCQKAFIFSKKSSGRNLKAKLKETKHEKILLTECRFRYFLIKDRPFPVIVSSRSKNDLSSFLKEMRLCLNPKQEIEEIKDMYGLKIVVPKEQDVEIIYEACLSAIKKHYPEARFLESKNLYDSKQVNKNEHSAAKFRSRDVVVMLGKSTKIFEFQVMTLPDHVNADHYAKGISHKDYELRRFFEENSAGISLAEVFAGRKLSPGFWQEKMRLSHNERIAEARARTGRQDPGEFGIIGISKEDLEKLRSKT